MENSVPPRADFPDLSGLLSCPDDGTSIEMEEGVVRCTSCGRLFSRHSDGVLELLPRNPTRLPASGVSESYRRGYDEEFRKKYPPEPGTTAWAQPESSPESWVRKRERQVRFVSSILQRPGPGEATVFCDLSAGTGYYTFSYAGKYRMVMHCDLSPGNLAYASAKAASRGLRNIAFLRIDYFNPPFRAVLPLAICLDTLERGLAHERLLLESIGRTLAGGGTAIVDFHNVHHNPLRRAGLLSENFRDNRSYSRRDVEGLFQALGLKSEYFPFRQEFEPGSLAERTIGKIVPPVRHLYRIFQVAHISAGASPTACPRSG
jgi:SAM-dependent methyltransferase